MIRPTPRLLRTATLRPSTPRFRSLGAVGELHAAVRQDVRHADLMAGEVPVPVHARHELGVLRRILEADEEGVDVVRPALAGLDDQRQIRRQRSEEHTSELQSLMRISYAVFCLNKKKKKQQEN